MIENLPGFPDHVVALSAKGHVTRSDYDQVVIPAVDAALKRHAKIRLYYEIGPQFSSIDPGAAWEDMVVGIEHLTRWERVALVSDVEWIKTVLNAFRFLMPGKLRVFSAAEAGSARDWILQP